MQVFEEEIQQNRKYEIRKDIYKTVGLPDGSRVKVFKIESLVGIKDRVGAGCLGGWVESESNLSQEGRCWIDGESVVCGDAVVRDSALVATDALVYGGAVIEGYADVRQARVGGNAVVSENALVDGTNTRISGNAKVSGNAEVSSRPDACCVIDGNAWVYEHADIRSSHIGENAEVSGDSVISFADIHGNADVHGGTHMYGEKRNGSDTPIDYSIDIYGDAEIHGVSDIIYGGVEIRGCVKIYGHAYIHEKRKIESNSMMTICGHSDIGGTGNISGKNVKITGFAEIEQFGDIEIPDGMVVTGRFPD